MRYSTLLLQEIIINQNPLVVPYWKFIPISDKIYRDPCYGHGLFDSNNNDEYLLHNFRCTHVAIFSVIAFVVSKQKHEPYRKER